MMPVLFRSVAACRYPVSLNHLLPETTGCRASSRSTAQRMFRCWYNFFCIGCTFAGESVRICIKISANLIYLILQPIIKEVYETNVSDHGSRDGLPVWQHEADSAVRPFR